MPDHPSGGLALVSFRSAWLKNDLLMPTAPAGRRRCRGTTADRLVGRVSHNEPTLLRTSINKSRLVMRRWLRDISCGHRVILPSRDCFKRHRPRRLREARTSGVISQLVAVFQSSVRSRLDQKSRWWRRSENSGTSSQETRAPLRTVRVLHGGLYPDPC